jgi:hypothetical protein
MDDDESVLILPQKALSERGIDKMLNEVRQDNKENDAEHMKPVSSLMQMYKHKLIHV